MSLESSHIEWNITEWNRYIYYVFCNFYRIRIKTGRFTRNVEYFWKEMFPLTLRYQNRRMAESHTKRQGSMCSNRKERWFTSACHRLTSVTASRYELHVIGIFDTDTFFSNFVVKCNHTVMALNEKISIRENYVTWNHL